MKILSKNVFYALNSHYDKFDDLYLVVLNILHDFRLAKFEIAKSKEKIRECTIVRVGFSGNKSMRCCDF